MQGMTAFTVILSPSPSGTWAAYCPGMPGAAAQGDSRDDALAAVADVMSAWLEIALGDDALVADERPEVVAVALSEIIADRAAEGWPLTVETVVVTPSTAVAA